MKYICRKGMLCGECRYFSFLEDDIKLNGKCTRDSLYDFKVVNARDIRCISCQTCMHLVFENNIWKCFWRNQIGPSSIDPKITPRCEKYNIPHVNI